jgi:hypothetical protein
VFENARLFPIFWYIRVMGKAIPPTPNLLTGVYKRSIKNEC